MCCEWIILHGIRTRNSPIRNREDCILVFVSDFFSFFFFQIVNWWHRAFFFIRIVQREGKQSERAKLRVNETNTCE